MARIILVTGGTRSGKSDYALQRGENIPGKRCFLATCVVSDDEMSERVRKHQAQRASERWETAEEPVLLAEFVLSNSFYDVYLIDCLTLWINNLMLDCAELGRNCTEESLEEEANALLEAFSEIQGSVILVSGEVGLGIVPDNKLARNYRDLVGLCNQIFASQADEVVLVSCGLPFYLKKSLK